MPSIAELEAQLQAQRDAEAKQAQVEEFKEVVPADVLDTAIKEVAYVYNGLIQQIGLQFGEDGNLIVPENTGQILDVSYKVWFTLGRSTIDQKTRPQSPPQQQQQFAAPANGNGGQPAQANIPPSQQAARAPSAGGRSAYCSCDHNCRNNYQANANTHYVCGCETLGCTDTKYGKACGCIARPGEILRPIDNKWRWMPN